MTDSDNLSAKTVTFVAVDIAKQSHDALVRWPSGQTQAIKITNSLGGYQCLLDLVRSGGETVYVGFEPTADYHRNLAYWLQAQGVRCFLISSLACARAR